jgi:membrane protease YdiL (CAAX protease family)
MTENRFRPQFTPDCTKWEIIFGWVYLFVHMFAFPLLLPYLQQHAFPQMTEIQANALYYGVSLAVVMVVFWKLLRREFDHLLDRFFRCVGGIFISYFLWYALSILMTGFMTSVGLDTTTPNDQAVDLLAKESYNIAMVISVIAAPIAEEVLFRGIAFQSIRKKNRFMAYAVSLLLFGLYHVWQYAVFYQDVKYLLFILQYLPITFALTWCYEYTGSLWPAIFFHASNNYLAMSLLKYL